MKQIVMALLIIEYLRKNNPSPISRISYDMGISEPTARGILQEIDQVIPLIKKRGVNGGISLPESYYATSCLSKEQIDVLIRARKHLTSDEDKGILDSVIRKFADYNNPEFSTVLALLELCPEAITLEDNDDDSGIGNDSNHEENEQNQENEDGGDNENEPYDECEVFGSAFFHNCRISMFPDRPDILTVDDLCEMLGIGKNKGYEMIQCGEIPSARIDSRYLIPKLSVTEFILKGVKNGLLTNEDLNQFMGTDNGMKSVSDNSTNKSLRSKDTEEDAPKHDDDDDDSSVKDD